MEALIFLSIIAILYFAFIMYIKKSKITEINEVEDMKESFIFRHPCGTMHPNNDNPIIFDRDEAVEFAKSHPYHYVKNCYDNEYIFAYKYFNLNESKTI